MANHSIAHVEFSAQNAQAAGEFYAEVFGWQIEPIPEMNYVMFNAGDTGGGFPQTDGDMFKPGDVVVYVNTDDIDASLAKIETAGGKTLVSKSEIPGMGWFAMFSDPTGNRVGLYTAMGEQ